MKLPYEEKTFRHVDYGDLDEFLSFHTGRPYESCCMEEWNNDSSKEMRIDGKLEDYQRRAVEKFINTGQGSYLTRALLNHLCADGILEPGDYLINISW